MEQLVVRSYGVRAFDERFDNTVNVIGLIIHVRKKYIRNILLSRYSSHGGHDPLATLEAHVSERQRLVFSCALRYLFVTRGAMLTYEGDGQILGMRVTALHGRRSRDYQLNGRVM